jgi:hypothetical protein
MRRDVLLVRSLLVGVIAIAVIGCGRGTSAPSAAPTPSLAAPTAAALAPLSQLKLQATIPESMGASEILATDDALWALIHEDALLIRIDPATNEITGKVQLEPGYAYRLGLAGGRLWTFHQLAGKVIGVDPVTMKVVASVSVGEQGDLFWVGDGAAWLIHGGDLNRVDGKTAKLSSTPLPDCGIYDAAAGGGSIWFATGGGGLCQVDEQTGAIVKEATGAWHGTGLAVVDGAVWLPGADNGLAIVDPTTLEITTAVPPPASGTVDGATYSIGTPGGDNTVVFADSAGQTGWLRYTGATIGRVDLGADPAIVLYAGLLPGLYASNVTEAFGSLWVTNLHAGEIQRFEVPAP